GSAPFSGCREDPVWAITHRAGTRTSQDGRRSVNERAVAIRLSGWRVMGYVRWATALVPASLVLTIVALLVQPPVQAATRIPAKADPALYAQANANPGRTFPVIVREQRPASSAAEDLVKGMGGRVTHELSLVGGFSARVPG